MELGAFESEPHYHPFLALLSVPVAFRSFLRTVSNTFLEYHDIALWLLPFVVLLAYRSTPGVRDNVDRLDSPISRQVKRTDVPVNFLILVFQLAGLVIPE